jgi:hypothetical protein
MKGNNKDVSVAFVCINWKMVFRWSPLAASVIAAQKKEENSSLLT